MISYYAAEKGSFKNRVAGFIEYDYPNVGQLAEVICQYTWSPTIFRNQRRHGDNFLFADLCVMDIDNDKPELPVVSIDQIKQEFIDCKMVIGTTKSHQISKNGKPPQDRFRVLIPFERRVTCAGEYFATMQGLMGMFDFLDKSCKDPGRQFFPCTRLVYVQDGETIPIAKYDPIQHHPSQIKFEQFKNASRGVSKNVLNFLDHGTVFDGGRNTSIYHTAQDLLKVGLTFNDTIALISEAPFDRSHDWSDKELFATCIGVYKRAGLM